MITFCWIHFQFDLYFNFYKDKMILTNNTRSCKKILIFHIGVYMYIVYVRGGVSSAFSLLLNNFYPPLIFDICCSDESLVRHPGDICPHRGNLVCGDFPGWRQAGSEFPQ